MTATSASATSVRTACMVGLPLRSAVAKIAPCRTSFSADSLTSYWLGCSQPVRHSADDLAMGTAGPGRGGRAAGDVRRRRGSLRDEPAARPAAMAPPDHDPRAARSRHGRGVHARRLPGARSGRLRGSTRKGRRDGGNRRRPGHTQPLRRREPQRTGQAANRSQSNPRASARRRFAAARCWFTA